LIILHVVIVAIGTLMDHTIRIFTTDRNLLLLVVLLMILLLLSRDNAA